jgi:hypothetical protein
MNKPKNDKCRYRLMCTCPATMWFKKKRVIICTRQNLNKVADTERVTEEVDNTYCYFVCNEREK